MKGLIAAALLLASAAPAHAKTILCIPESSAAVRQKGDTFTGGPLDTGSKFILTDESGRWAVKHHPSGATMFDNCINENFCDAGEMFAGTFMRDPREHGPQGRSIFTVFWMTQDDTSSYANVAKGYCTEL